MNTKASRVPERVQWAIDLLDVGPLDHILEIGCGPGHSVSLIAERLTRGTITAIDRSPVAVTKTRERNRNAIASQRARVERTTLEDADLGLRFDKVFAINVNVFWTDPSQSLPILTRLLGPKGIAWLIYEPPSAGRLRDLRESLPRDMESNGLRVARVETQRFRSTVGLAILGQPR